MKSGASVLAVLVGEPPVLLHLYDISPLVLPPPATLILDFLSVQRRQHQPLTSALFQVLLSQVHRLRALDLLGRFLDLGPWAVSLVRFCYECLKNNNHNPPSCAQHWRQGAPRVLQTHASHSLHHYLFIKSKYETEFVFTDLEVCKARQYSLLYTYPRQKKMKNLRLVSGCAKYLLCNFSGFKNTMTAEY